MQNNGQPSWSAQTAAAARAAHLIVDHEPHVFRDSLAETLLGDRADELIAYHRAHGDHPILAGARAAVVTRSRFAEDRLARSRTGRYLILGAGLDSYAYRADGTVTVVEIDHPATQEWKRERLERAGIAIPESVSFVPADLEREMPDLSGERTFASWLGVVMYLTPEAIDETLAALGRLAPGSEVVIDHVLPERERDERGRAYADAVGGASAERGEPWLSSLDEQDIAALLDRHGFDVVEQARQDDLVAWPRTDALRPTALMVLTHARRR